MLFGGLEFQLTQYMIMTPNTVITVYDHNDQGIKTRTDFHLRLTLFLKLE
jgi:hypothetical protein